MASANARPGNRGGHQLVSLLLLLAVSLVAGPAAWSADPPVQRWPIKEFEVVSARPWIDASGPFDAWLNRLSEQSGAEFDQRMAAEEPLNLAMRDAMEDYLNRAARQLEAWGFPPPRLEPIVTRRDGKRAYRVFYTDLADASGEYWYKRRGYEGLRRRPVIILSGSSDTLSWPIQTGSTRGVTVSPFGKSVLGHELFHAVQYSMPFFRSGSYDVGDWVAEGTAEAVGEDLYRILEGMFGQDAERAWGLRNYAIRLPVQRVSARATPPLATYGTASFWRYLAELHARPRHGKPGPDPQSVDYGYLVALFNRTAGSSGAAAELRWLDEGLREAQRIGAKGLYRIFPDFISTYAAYGEHRAKSYPGDWRKDSFGACVSLAITPITPTAVRFTSLGPVAARCIDVDASAFPEPVTFTVQVRAASDALAAQTTLGTAGGQRVSHDPMIANPPFPPGEPRPWVVTTVFLSTPGEIQSLVLANVAEEPWDTKEQDVLVEVSTSGYVTNLQTPSPPADTTGPPTDPPPGPAGARKAAAEDMRRAVGRTTQTGVTVVRLDRQPEDTQRCRSRDRQLNLCGPQLAITLRRQSASSDMMTATMGTAGFVVQALAGAGAMLDNLPEVVESARQARRESEYTEAGTIQLSMPYVDYGFTGRLTNVRMTVTREGGGEYLAVGPRDIEPGGMTLFPPSAEVTIEDYTPTFMAGTFSAQLIDPKSLPGGTIPLASRESRPTLPVARRIEGRFFLTAPWRDDDRTQGTLLDDPEASMLIDVSEMLPTGPDGWAIDFGASAPPAAPPAGAPGAGPSAAATHGCDCSCEAYARMEAEMEAMEQAARAGDIASLSFHALARCAMYCPREWADCD